MRLSDVVQFVDGTSDPAFAVDGLGNIAAWNAAAVEMLGIASADALSKPCNEVICGEDEDGRICSTECLIRQSANKSRPMRNFDLRIDGPNGEKWFNVSLIIVDVTPKLQPYTIHILRLVDVEKRLKLLMRDFLVSETDISDDKVVALISNNRSVVRETYLTHRELELLRLVAKGKTSATIGEELNISPATVDNHLQHILKKLSVHSRLEAVLRAEHSGLL